MLYPKIATNETMHRKRMPDSETVGVNSTRSPHYNTLPGKCQHLLKGGGKLPRQNQLLGEMKARGIDRKSMCDKLLADYHEHVHPTELSAILYGSRSETPKGQRVIGFIKRYFEKTQ